MSDKNTSTPWLRLLVSLTALSGSMLAGCGGGITAAAASSTTAPPAGGSSMPPAQFATDSVNQMPDSAFATVSVAVSTQIAAVPVLPDFIGLSWEKSVIYSPLFHVQNPGDGGNNLYKLLNLLSLQGSFRIGANSLAYAVWDPSGAGEYGDKPGDIKYRGPLINGKPSPGGKVSPPDIDALAQMIHNTGWNVIYAVPASYNFFKSDPTAKTFTSPSYASDIAADVQEASYAAGALGSALYGMEIGNEPDIAGIASTYYLPDWLNYAKAIQGNPQKIARFVGPATSSLTSSLINTVISDPVAGGLVTQVTAHRYLGSGAASSSTIADMLSKACPSSLQTSMASLEQASKPVSDGWRLDETNSYYAGGRVGVSDSFASSLWTLEYMFCAAQQGAHGINFHVQDDTNPEQLDPTLNGTFQNAYTPLQISKGQVTKVMPVFYGMKLFSLALQADSNSQGASVLSPQSVAVSVPDGLQVVAFSAIPNNGSSGKSQSPGEIEAVVIINKESAQAVKAVVNPGIVSQSADYIRLTSGPVSTSGATAGLQGIQNSVLNNQLINVNGSWQPESYAPLAPAQDGSYSVKIPAASAILLRLR